jgi:fumarate hydratase subunit alpha
MRTITFDKVVSTVEELCISAAHELPADVTAAIEKTLRAESNARAKSILQALLENAQIARKEFIPICQDTGIAVVFVEQGADLRLQPSSDNPASTLVDAINLGVLNGYDKGYLRKSIVAEPLFKRQNTKTNTPAIIHYSLVPGDRLKISVMPKGGGCENKSSFKMFKPTSEPGDVIDWVTDVVKSAGADACPPFIVGVGLGGNFETACLLAKKALLRPIGSTNPDQDYARLESEMLARINMLGIGPQGLGGDTTALGLCIETAPCHIASLPAAVNIECHAHRHKSAEL